jgi:HD-GYP domain-containing protein (c-di-GMP phosphodiesterase class II)
VEAKDPDTAGHSLRVQRVALALGEELELSPQIIRHHHERWDGGGYPDGLAAGDIPLEAAIVGLADSWDAMTTDRPYHRPLKPQEGFAEIRNGRGTQFAPVVVDAFFAAAARRPADFGLESPPEAVLQAV